jgi:two-component system response regulator NreC
MWIPIQREAHGSESIYRSRVHPLIWRIEFMKRLRILLADDHIVMRTGLRALLERQPNLEVVGESENGRETAELAASLRPDVVVMDIGMPMLNGIEATKTIVSQRPSTAVVILSMHADESYVMRALSAGARGYLLKDSAAADLIGAIQAVSQGKSFFSPRVSRILAEDYVRVLEQKGAVDTYDLLTSREREILQLLAEGKANKEVATDLNISTYTVETHRSHILQKLNLHNSAELVLYAVRKGIIS